MTEDNFGVPDFFNTPKKRNRKEIESEPVEKGFSDDEIYISRSPKRTRNFYNSSEKINAIENDVLSSNVRDYKNKGKQTGFDDNDVYISRPKRFNAEQNAYREQNYNKGRNLYNSYGRMYIEPEEDYNLEERIQSVMNKKKKKRKKRRRWLHLFLIFLIALSVLSAGAFYYVWNSSFFQNDTDSGAAGLNPEIAGMGDEVVNILVLGIDNDEGRRENMLTDTIMVVSIDCKQGMANVLQIPRDTYIGTDYTATGKINALYSSNSEYSGIEGLSNFIYENTGIPLDHYITITMEGLRNAIDAIGGVTIDVPYEVDLDGVYLEPGVQTLDGNEAEKLIRQRHGEGYENGDLDRLEVQRMFMASLVEQFLGVSKSTLLSTLTKVSDEVSSDLTTGDMVDLLSGVSGMSADSIGFYMVPGQTDYVYTDEYGRQSVYTIHKQALTDLINQYFLAGREPITIENIGLPEINVDETAFDDVGGSVNEILNGESSDTTSSTSQSSNISSSTISGSSSKTSAASSSPSKSSASAYTR